ncbi:conserved protein of unknown function [Tenacibaculum sp. 190130A14a]|uniref:Uncharacterized protein n=1 Tax=Tenacibaculum polynesiense TaxID=3137857 RepID=A0ABM9P823_9FLAO
MGLDIYLIKIVEKSESKFEWFSDEENPELRIDYSDFLTTRKVGLENSEIGLEKGYHSVDISYQRKGVKPVFFKKFKADDFIFTLDKLLELKKCVKKEYLDTFQSNFMEKFKEKENFILISY